MLNASTATRSPKRRVSPRVSRVVVLIAASRRGESIKRRPSLASKVPRESAFQRLVRHFHEHPRGRFHEFLFWAGLGLTLGALALWGHFAGWMSLPYVLMVGIVALCLFGWAFLPQKRGAPKPPPVGKRGVIADQVRASKAERKRKKGGGPPPPPIRRG